MTKFSLLASAAVVLLVGCTSIISYPVSNPEPFQDMERIGVQASSRDYIASLLGQPQLKLEQDKLWVYGQSRITWEKVPPPHEHEYYALMIWFEKGLAAGYDIASSKYSFLLCWSNDMCLDGHWIPMESEHGPKKLSRQFSAVTSRGGDDQSAKMFHRDEHNCSIYVYRGFDIFQLPYPPAVTLGSANDEPIPSYGYLLVKVKPGTHRLETSDKHIEFQCSAGDLLFYSVSNSAFGSEPATDIEKVDEQRGKAKINGKRILVTW